MSAIPRDRPYFHYKHLHNSVGTSGRQIDPGAKTMIRVWGDPRVREIGVRVADSLQQLVVMLKRDGLGASFSGTFYIDDARHTANARSVNVTGWDYVAKERIQGSSAATGGTVLSHVRVQPGASSPGRVSRLSRSAPDLALSIQSELLTAGFVHASFVALQERAQVEQVGRRSSLGRRRR